MEKSTRKNFRFILIVISIILLVAISLQTSFAIGRPVDNSTAGGGIRQGLNSAAPNGDVLLLDEGNYTGTNNTNLIINKNVTIQGNGPIEKVIIDAQRLNGIFNLSTGINVKFINVTFLNRNITASSNTYNGGQ